MICHAVQAYQGDFTDALISVSLNTFASKRAPDNLIAHFSILNIEQCILFVVEIAVHLVYFTFIQLCVHVLN